MGPGSLIGGKYRIKHRIGQGAMGVVWAAVHELIARDVAIKLIPRYSIATDMLRTRLIREARACGRISHRNVVEVLDAGQTDEGDPFLVMALLSGETLGSRMKREKKMDPRDVAQITTEIARGLSAAHEAGIVHRDLKPANLMLHRERDIDQPVVKVLDFGISKILTGEEGSAASVGVVGSPGYMSPQQIRGEKVDHRTDLWSLGVIVFEMLTGTRPFPADSGAVAMTQILAGQIPLLSEVAPELDPVFGELVASCLERDPRRRIASAADVVALLRVVCSSRGSFASIPAPGGLPEPAPAEGEADATSTLQEHRPEPAEQSATSTQPFVRAAPLLAAPEAEVSVPPARGRLAVAVIAGLALGTVAAVLAVIVVTRRGVSVPQLAATEVVASAPPTAVPTTTPTPSAPEVEAQPSPIEPPAPAPDLVPAPEPAPAPASASGKAHPAARPGRAPRPPRSKPTGPKPKTALPIPSDPG